MWPENLGPPHDFVAVVVVNICPTSSRFGLNDRVTECSPCRCLVNIKASLGVIYIYMIFYINNVKEKTQVGHKNRQYFD